MPTSPGSPDKPLVASAPGKETDNTGWIVAMMKEQRETLITIIEDQKELLMKVIEANDVRYDQRFEASKEAITAALSAAKEAITAALSASDRAVLKAESANEKRFEGVNEFRSTLADQQRTLMPRTEAEAIFKNMGEKIDANSKLISETLSNREGRGQGWQYAVGAIGLIATLLSIVSVALVLFRR